MKLKISSLIWTFLWCMLMGVTAISIGFGALFPSMNLISKPFVCPRGEMSVYEQVYRPYPGKTVTTLTWYCVDTQSGDKTELGIFPMVLYAGLIYGFGLFVVVFIGMWIFANRSASGWLAPGYGARGLARLRKQEQDSIRDAQYSSQKFFDESRYESKPAESASSRMKELKDLRDANMISESEYQEKRAEILKNL